MEKMPERQQLAGSRWLGSALEHHGPRRAGVGRAKTQAAVAMGAALVP